MAVFTIEAGGPQAVPAGNYTATFQGLEKIETQKGEAARWPFKTDDGLTISSLSDASRPTTKNKLGRFLAGLAAKPLAAGTTVDPSEYVGRRYMVIVVDKGDGKTDIAAFSPL